MGLASFSELKASVASWVKRSDLASQIPDFITLGEARIARDLRLRAQLITSTAATVANTATVDLPTGWLEFSGVTLDGYGVIEPAPTNLGQAYTDTPGRPRWMTAEETVLRLFPTPDGAYPLTWTYYQRFALSDAAPTNWLLTNHPGVYLWAALAEAAPFCMNDERAVTWEAKYRADADALQAADDRARFAGTPLRVRAA